MTNSTLRWNESPIQFPATDYGAGRNEKHITIFGLASEQAEQANRDEAIVYECAANFCKPEQQRNRGFPEGGSLPPAQKAKWIGIEGSDRPASHLCGTARSGGSGFVSIYMDRNLSPEWREELEGRSWRPSLTSAQCEADGRIPRGPNNAYRISIRPMRSLALRPTDASMNPLSRGRPSVRPFKLFIVE